MVVLSFITADIQARLWTGNYVRRAAEMNKPASIAGIVEIYYVFSK